MVVMYQFCFWFSVRLGSIIVGAVSLLQGVAGLTASCLAVGHPDAVSRSIGHLLDNYQLLFVADLLAAVKQDPGGVSTAGAVFAGVYVSSCLLLVFAAFKCNWYLALPYVGLDFLRLTFTTAAFVVGVIVVKENILDLGVIIAVSVLGGFVLLYLFYMWLCTVSFCQTVRALHALASEGEAALANARFAPAPAAPAPAAGYQGWMPVPGRPPPPPMDFRAKQFALARPVY